MERMQLIARVVVLATVLAVAACQPAASTDLNFRSTITTLPDFGGTSFTLIAPKAPMPPPPPPPRPNFDFIQHQQQQQIFKQQINDAQTTNRQLNDLVQRGRLIQQEIQRTQEELNRANLDRGRREAEEHLLQVTHQQMQFQKEMRQFAEQHQIEINIPSVLPASIPSPARTLRDEPTQPFTPSKSTWSGPPIAAMMASFMVDKMNGAQRRNSKDPRATGKTETAITIGRYGSPLYLDPTKTNCTTALLEALQSATGANFAGGRPDNGDRTGHDVTPTALPKDMTTREWNEFFKTWQMERTDLVAQEGNEYRQGAVKAIVDYGMGERIESLDDVQDGDIIQAFPATSGTDGDLMMVLVVSDEGGGFIAISAGWGGPNAYRTKNYSIDKFNKTFKEYFIGRFYPQ